MKEGKHSVIMVTNDKAILSKFDNAKTPIDISRVYVKQEIK